MPMNPEQTVREFLGSFGTSVEQDEAAYLRYLAEDVHIFTGTTIVEGSRAMVEAARRAWTMLGLRSWTCTIVNLLADGDTVMTERQDYQLDGNMKLAFVVPIMGLFKVSGGRIVEWRDYWDVRQLMAHGESFRAAQGMPPMPYGDDPGAGARAVMAAIARGGTG